jgi:hypothetical protein
MLDVTAERSYSRFLVKLEHADATVLLALREFDLIVFHFLDAVDDSFF